MGAKPFLFGEAFDDLGDAPPPRRAPPKKLDEAAVEAERQTAFAKGLAEGEAKGRADAEAEANERHQNIRDVIARLMSDAITAAESAEAATTAAAGLAAARAVGVAFPTLAEARGGEEILTTIRASLARASDEQRLVIRLAADDYEEIGGELTAISDAAGFPGRIVNLEDASVAPGDVRVEWADGGLSRNLERLTGALTDALAGLAGPVSSQTPPSSSSEEISTELTPETAAETADQGAT